MKKKPNAAPRRRRRNPDERKPTEKEIKTALAERLTVEDLSEAVVRKHERANPKPSPQ